MSAAANRRLWQFNWRDDFTARLQIFDEEVASRIAQQKQRQSTSSTMVTTRKETEAATRSRNE